MTNPRLEQLLVTVRDPTTVPSRFREAVYDIGTILGYELAEELARDASRAIKVKIKTCMKATARHYPLNEPPVLVAILRAGLPLANGVHSVFPDADMGFIGSKRDERTLEPERTYVALPSLTGKTVIVCDTMLATGGSMFDAIELVQKRHPSDIYVCSVIAARQGMEHIHRLVPDERIYCGAIDQKLNKKGYIVPGLGDAGDRAFGEKID